MEIVQEKDLLDLSTEIAAEWEFVARYLIIKEAQINIFKKDYDQTREQIYQMLLFWKRKNGNGATYRVLTQALRQAERNDLADDLSLRHGFGRFIVDVATIFTLAIALQLAAVYSLPEADVGRISNHVNHGWMLLDILKQKGEITPTDISSLTEALNHIGFHGIAVTVEDSFKRNVSVNLSSPAGYLTLEDDTRRSFAGPQRLYRTRRRARDDSRPYTSLEPPGFIAQNSSAKADGVEDQFLRQIKEKYKDLYNAVQPIPYIKDRLYCVDKVFVEGGVEFSCSAGGRPFEWKSLKSYRDILRDPGVKSKRRILEGEPGYGKSTITLQFAYDWCNTIHDYVPENIKLLILLKLRQLGRVSSIYRAIKQFTLPKDTTITEKDIENILRNSNSVLVILDGFDEYPDKESIQGTDIMNIIDRQMFQEYDVVTTTRSSFLPKKYSPLTKRVRLTGFDDNSRRFYIRKAVVGEDEERVREIEQYLEENPILRDLCQVPLLFVIFAHMAYDREEFRNLHSVTSFFRYMISCFHSHMRNKMADENVRKYELFETKHSELDRVAFEAFSGDTQKIVWEKKVLCKQIGQEFYDQYVRVGILVEEEVINYSDGPGTRISNEHVQYKTEVRFYHKLFCEWYAAHYLADYLQHNPNVDLSSFLQHLDPFDVQYMYRFSCGLNSDSAEKIISFLKYIEGGDKFAILCILEQIGKVDHIKETIRELCFEGVIISGYDSLLLQRSSMQLLELAARNDIPIEHVNLSNCLQSVDLSTSAIRTTSGLALTSRIPVKVLWVHLFNRDMTKDEAIDILQFASMCPSLRMLVYGNCVPPRSFSVGPTLSTLKTRNVKVWWRWAANAPWYILNLQSGRWENEDDGSEPAQEFFERAISKLAERRAGRTEETYITHVKGARDFLRKKAQKRQGNPR